MRKTYLYSTLILSLFSLSIAASSRLTVVAVVDGLDSDNLAMLRPYWQKGGLRTLSEEAYQTSVAFPHEVYGGNETTATLMTGTTPDRHGYTMDRYFLRRDRLLHGMLEDESAKGIGTSLCLSAKALLSRTLSDRMRLLSPAAKIYAVGIQPETTVLMAGHAANACCWLDCEAQQWVASSAYSEGLPSAAYEQNSNMRIPTLAARQWTPRMDIPTYSCPTPQEQKKGFSYEVAPVLAYTPTANTLVIELALALQQSERLGVDAQPDLRLLQLNSLSPKATSDRIAAAEREDMYRWLNQVVGRPMLGTDAQTLADLHMPIQYFNVDRAAALTGTYLMAIYGHERWVDGGYGQSVYLNRTLIEQKRLNLETIQRQVANFLMDFEGVQIALPAHEALLYPPLASTLSKRHMGDVVFMLQPGWQLMQNDSQTIDRVTDERPTSPLLYWSGTLRPMPQGKIDATGLINLLFE